MANRFPPVLDKSGNKVPHLFLNRDSGFIYVRKTFKRYRIPPLFETTGEKAIMRARVKAQEMIAEHMNSFLGSDRDFKSRRFDSKTIGEVIDEINEVDTPTFRIKTQIHRKLYLGEIKKELGRIDMRRFDLMRWHDWLGPFMARKGRKTYWDYAKHMNIISHFAYKHKYTSHLVRVPNPDRKKAAERVYTTEEISALSAAMVTPETVLQFVLSYENYMRLTEVLHLRWDQIDLVTGEIRLGAEDVKTGSKTGKGRTFKVSPQALDLLKARRAEMGRTSPYVFPSPRNPKKPVNQNATAWRAAKRRAKIRGQARWHAIRHTAISHAILVHGVPPILVSEFSGVSMATIQKVYLHSTAENTKRAGEVLKITIPKV